MRIDYGVFLQIPHLSECGTGKLNTSHVWLLSVRLQSLPVETYGTVQRKRIDHELCRMRKRPDTAKKRTAMARGSGCP